MLRIEIEETSTGTTAPPLIFGRGSNISVVEVRKEAVPFLYRLSISLPRCSRGCTRNIFDTNPSGSRSLPFCLHFNWLSDLVGGFHHLVEWNDRFVKSVASSHPLRIDFISSRIE